MYPRYTRINEGSPLNISDRMPALATHPSFFALAVLGAALTLAACSDDGTRQTQAADPSADTEEQSGSKPEAQDAKPEAIGSISIDGQSYELIRSFWCEPRSGVEEGTEVVAQVGAFHDDGRFMTVMATQVDRDRDRPSVVLLRANEPGTDNHFESGNSKGPVLTVEDGRVLIQGQVASGGEIVPLEAEFTLPEEPGLKFQC